MGLKTIALCEFRKLINEQPAVFSILCCSVIIYIFVLYYIKTPFMAPANSMIKLPTIIQGISKLVDGLFFQQNLLCVKASSNSVSCLKIYL